MKHKLKAPFKYRVDIAWSDADKCYVARVPELPGCVTDGNSIEEAAVHAEEAIAVYMETLDDQKKPYPPALSERKFSGKVPLRISQDLHRDLTARAMSEDLSLNQFIERKLKKEI
ncbi:type II toxin-antitoxin system HicB family antitoxin [Bdellovibrionota bacterium FG-2]